MKVTPVTIWLTEKDVGTSGCFGLRINDKYFVIERKGGEVIFTEKVYNWERFNKLALDIGQDVS